jgi:hypothetical protein
VLHRRHQHQQHQRQQQQRRLLAVAQQEVKQAMGSTPVEGLPSKPAAAAAAALRLLSFALLGGAQFLYWR